MATQKDDYIASDGERFIVHAWHRRYMMGGLLQDGDVHHPITEENIAQLENYKDLYWKPSVYQAIKNFVEKTRKHKQALTLLNKLTIDSISGYPVLFQKAEETPFKNQVIGQYWSKYLPYHAKVWDMGTGKTRASIEGYSILKKDGKVHKMLVVCPVSMIDKWIDECNKWNPDIQAAPLKYTRESKKAMLLMDWEVMVVNYETVITLMDELTEWMDNKTLMLLDEFTKIKNPVAKRTKAIIKLSKITPFKDMLSGSPITQHAYDIFAPYLFLDGGKTFGLNYESFLETYFWRDGYRLHPKRHYDHRADGTSRSALEAISDKMYESATRFRKKDCIDIPDKVYAHRIIELPPYNKKKYDEMVQWCITSINSSNAVTAPVILTQLLRLSQITSGFAKTVNNQVVEFEENPKIDALRDILEECNGDKVVIWGRFQHDVERITKLCDEMKIKSVQLYGETKPDDRTKNIKTFQTGDAQVIVGTASTGGHGIDLTAASVVIYYSNSYSLEQRIQSEDRTHRAGQTQKVTYIDIMAKGTIDYSIYKILRDKKNVADIVTKDNLSSLL